MCYERRRVKEEGTPCVFPLHCATLETVHVHSSRDSEPILWEADRRGGLWVMESASGADSLYWCPMKANFSNLENNKSQLLEQQCCSKTQCDIFLKTNTTRVQHFGVIYFLFIFMKFIFVFSNNVLNWSKVTEKTFMTLQMMSKKFSSYDLSWFSQKYLSAQQFSIWIIIRIL